MKQLIALAALVLLASFSIPIKADQPSPFIVAPPAPLTNPEDLPVIGDALSVLIANENETIAIDTNSARIEVKDDVRTFTVLRSVNPKLRRPNDPVALVSRVVIDCKSNLIKQLRAYLLDANDHVVAWKSYEREHDYELIKKSSLGERAYPFICARPFHPPVEI